MRKYSPTPKQLGVLIRRYGDQSLSYSYTQADLRFFGDADGVVAYRKRMGVYIALGKPLCSAEWLPVLLDAFARHKRAVLFAQVDDATARCLRELRFYTTPVGVDSEINVTDFQLEGKSKGDLRHYRNRAVAGGVVVREEKDTDALRATLGQVTRHWIRRKLVRSREIEFLVRPLAANPETGTRIFSGNVDGEVVAFVLFDPIHEQGRCTGYTTTILRSLSSAPEGTLDFIILHAVERFRNEGLVRLSLGVSPMHKMDEVARQSGRGAHPLYWACRQLYRQRWQPIMNIRGLSFHKSRYRANERPVFIATKSCVGLWEMTALCRACRII